MKLVIIESPFAGDTENNIKYARACVRDSLLRGESPIASHLLYTQEGILDDNIQEERQLGIDSGLMWKTVANCTVVYTDKGISEGMKYGIEQAKLYGLPVEFRTLYNNNNNNNNEKDSLLMAQAKNMYNLLESILESDECDPFEMDSSIKQLLEKCRGNNSK